MDIDDPQQPANSSQHSVSDAKLSDDSFNNNNHSGCTADDVPDGHPDDGTAEKPLKKGRKRKRHIYNAIRETMEFYFSDANLSKDRFLMRLIEQDPEVPLATFLSFNKIKSLCSAPEDIEKALATSAKLRLSVDHTKVARCADLSSLQTRCPDDCTVYVEALPMNATHDWVRHIFEQYGPVAYVSLPKYRWSQRIKEFAFVEFESKAGVLRAMQAFAELGAVLNATGSDPDKLGSVLAYLREQEEELAAEEKLKAAAKKSKRAKGKQKQVAVAAGADGAAPTSAEAAPAAESADGKPAAAAADDREPLEKRRRLKSDPEQAAEAPVPITIVGTDDCTAAAEEIGNVAAAAEDDSAAADTEPADAGNKSKVRRKKSAAKSGAQAQPAAEMQLEASVEATLRITTKLEWKRLRNKYLNQQRERVKQMKKQMWLARQKERCEPDDPEEPVDDPDDARLAIDVQPEPEHSANMNFYGANRSQAQPNWAAIAADGGDLQPTEGGQQQQQQQLFAKRAVCNAPVPAEGSPGPAAAVKQPLFAYEPGIIVQIWFDAPCVDVKDFKGEMRQHACVQYVDVREGDMCAFVRVASGVEAPELCAKTAPLRADILHGEAERVYWEKIGADREQKLSKALRLKPKRGREKMRDKLAVAAMQVNHVRFDD